MFQIGERMYPYCSYWNWSSRSKITLEITYIQFGVFCMIFNNRYALLPEKAMAPHSSTLAWKIPWTEEPGRLQSIGLRRIGHDWATPLSPFTFMHWRRKWQPTPVFVPGESQGQEPGGLPSMGSHRVGYDWCDLAAACFTTYDIFHYSNRWLSGKVSTRQCGRCGRRSLDLEDPRKGEMATCSRILAWKIPRTKEPGRLQSVGLQRVRYNWVTEQLV